MEGVVSFQIGFNFFLGGTVRMDPSPQIVSEDEAFRENVTHDVTS